MSPWLDLRVPKEIKLPQVEAQTHLPVDALVFSPHAKYVYVARDANAHIALELDHCLIRPRV